MTVDTQKLRELIAKAAPTPWFAAANALRVLRTDGGKHFLVANVDAGITPTADEESMSRALWNTDLIAEGITALPALLAERDALASEAETLRSHNALLRASIAQVEAEIDRLRQALEGLLNALPSATTHPAIQAARTALSTPAGNGEA